MSSEKTDQQIYHDSLSIIEPYLTRPALAKMSLAIHSAAPRIEAYHQYYRENIISTISKTSCQYSGTVQVWADINEEQAICDADDLTLKLDQNINKKPTKEVLLPFDHVLLPKGVTYEEVKQVVVVYTMDFTSDTFKSFHQALTRRIEKENQQEEELLAYIIRYIPPLADTCQQHPLALTGYGVEMALKKTDYLVIDDRDRQQQGSVKGKLTSFGKKISQTLFDDNTPAKIEPLTSQEIQGMLSLLLLILLLYKKIDAH